MEQTIHPDPTPKQRGGLGAAACRFLWLLPALVLACVCARALELFAGMQVGTTFHDAVRIVGLAIRQDVLSLARYLPGLFLVSLPFLLIRSRRGCFWSLGITWSLLVLVQVFLAQYFLTARVPLGADLFAYSWRDIRETVSAGARPDATAIAAFLLPVACLWSLLAWLIRRPWFTPSLRTTLAVFAAALLALFAAPVRFEQRAETEDAYNLALDKAAYFFDDSLGYFARPQAKDAASVTAGGGAASEADAAAAFQYLDPRYPFLRVEQTPDVLGPHFTIRAGQPPNLVFVIVEGLGRSFSGPDAALGSFTPFLDSLAGRSLYWDNFLAVQGRTFAVLPSLFGSLPFGDNGFSALGERMPARADTLLSVLKGQGYHLKFYGGTDLDFDNERSFLQRQGVEVLVGDGDYGPGYVRSPGTTSWGYADHELLSLALARENRDTPQPYVSVIQTITMHTPYTFPGQARYEQRFEQRLDALGVDAQQKDAYRAYRNIYASILYTDDALRRFFDEAKRDPAYQNTIFIVTGDHRLPEIPMSTRIDRYHVPFYIFSPLLKAPARSKAVSSHFDVAPSLLAFLSHNYGIRTPRAVTWVGSGLDMAPYFRNLHDVPLKQTKTNLVDFVSGDWFLNQDTLYAMSDGMAIEPIHDDAALARVQARFARFRAANDRFAHDLALMPADAAQQLVAYRELERAAPAAPASAGVALAVRDVRTPALAHVGDLTVEVDFANAGSLPSAEFVPLIVLLSGDGRELSESYGAAMTLAPGQEVSLRLPVNSRGVPAGRYFLTVIPSDPKTGKSVGVGRHQIPVRLQD